MFSLNSNLSTDDLIRVLDYLGGGGGGLMEETPDIVIGNKSTDWKRWQYYWSNLLHRGRDNPVGGIFT